MIPVALVGLAGAYTERPRLLAAYSWLAAVLALLLIALAVLSLTAGAAWDGIRLFVRSNCQPLVMLAPESWFAALAPGISCSKYYGTPSPFNATTGSAAAPTVGGGVGGAASLALARVSERVPRCANEREVAFAWEYNE